MNPMRVAMTVVMLFTFAACGSRGGSSPTAPTQTAQSPAQTYAVTTVSFSSDPSDFVGAGRSKTFTMADSSFSANVHNNGAYIDLTIRPSTGGPALWSFVLMAPANTRISPGSYSTVRDFGSNSWSASFSGEGRSCGNQLGRIVIHDFDFTAENEALKHFRASFEQHCDGSSAALRGEIAILADPWR